MEQAAEICCFCWKVWGDEKPFATKLWRISMTLRSAWGLKALPGRRKTKHYMLERATVRVQYAIASLTLRSTRSNSPKLVVCNSALSPKAPLVVCKVTKLGELPRSVLIDFVRWISLRISIHHHGAYGFFFHFLMPRTGKGLISRAAGISRSRRLLHRRSGNFECFVLDKKFEARPSFPLIRRSRPAGQREV